MVLWETKRGRKTTPSSPTPVTTPILGRHWENPGWVQVGFPEQLYQGEGRGMRRRVTLAPLTPKSLKVQTALMARHGSAHSGWKKEVKL